MIHQCLLNVNIDHRLEMKEDVTNKKLKKVALYVTAYTHVVKFP